MKLTTQTLTEFGDRLVTLNTGARGLRGGITCTVSAVAGEAPVMDFIASDETLDRYDEVIKVDGWQLDNFKRNPVIPDCHDYSSIAKILGRAQSVGVASGKLVNRVEFCLDNPMGNLAFKMAKGGFIKSQSVGFIPVEWVNGAGNDQPRRTYLKSELLEISLVVVPANLGATVGMKQALNAGAIEKADIEGVIDLLRGMAGYKVQSAKSKKQYRCGRCGSERGYWKEFGADCDAGQNYMAIYCPDCGHAGETEKEFCGEDAASGRQAGASASGSYDARLLQLARSFDAVLRGH